MTDDRGISPRSKRIVATHAAIAGLCPLIPIPFIDDLALRRVLQHMDRSLFAAHGLTLPRSGAKILNATPSRWWRGAVTSIVMFPVKKVLRKVVYVFAIKDCAEVASATFHDGWLLAHVVEDRPPRAEDPAYLRRVRKAMLKTYEAVDPAPLRRAMVGSFLGARVGVRHGFQALRRLLRGEAARTTESPAPATGVEAQLSAGVSAAANSEWKYMAALERTFRRHLGLAERGEGTTAAGGSPQGA